MHTRLQRTQSVSMRRNVPYGNAARTTMDIYIPAADKRGHGKGEPSAAATSSNQAASASGAELSNAPQAPHGAPVALFCHGGVWATGTQPAHLDCRHNLLQACHIPEKLSATLQLCSSAAHCLCPLKSMSECTATDASYSTQCTLPSKLSAGGKQLTE